MRHLIAVAAVALAAAAAIPTTPAMGGWVVTTIEDLPTHLEAGVPTTIEFTLRQHGESLMRGREPSVRIRSADAGWLDRGTTFDAVEAGPAAPGRYRATIVAEEAGAVELRIDADFNRQRITLLPVAVTAPGAAPAPAGHAERGRTLFVAKGCVTCHLVADDDAVAERMVVQAGPALTGRRLATEYVTAKLDDPRMGQAALASQTQMPDLGLDAGEIEALAAWLSSGVSGTVGSRR